MRGRIVAFLLLPVILFCFGAVNYQAKLTDSSGVGLNDTLDIVFRLYDSESGEDLLWEEPHTNVIVTRGLFTVLLGDSIPFPDSLTPSASYWLEIEVAGERLSPRNRFVPSHYAIRSLYSDTAGYAPPDSDWIKVGDNLSLLPSGNVGIGTSTPSEKLEVAGNIRLSGSSPTYRITNVASPVDGSDVVTRDFIEETTGSDIIYLKCGWTRGGIGVGSCTPPTCPSGWTDLGTYNEVTTMTGNCATVDYYGGYYCAYSQYNTGGNSVRICIK